MVGLCDLGSVYHLIHFLQLYLATDRVPLSLDPTNASNEQDLFNPRTTGHYFHSMNPSARSPASFPQLVLDPESVVAVIKFTVKNFMFKDFCVRLLEDTPFLTALFGNSTEKLTIDSQCPSLADGLCARRLLEIPQTCVNEMGPVRLQNRERFLLETLGSFVCTSDIASNSNTKLERSSESVL